MKLRIAFLIYRKCFTQYLLENSTRKASPFILILAILHVS